MTRTRPTLARAIAWIAENDEPTSLDVNEVEDLISVLLVADLFGKTPEAIADRVVRYREEGKAYCTDRRIEDASGAAGVVLHLPQEAL